MDNPFDLTGKTILVTGASSGIGKEAARIISLSGANVILTGRNNERLEEALSNLKGDGNLSISADLTKSDELSILVDQVPALDGVVFSAGITGHLPAKFIGNEDLSNFFDINYKAPVLLMSLLLRKKKINSKASLVFLSSIATKYPYFGGSLYGSTKAAIEAYSRVLAIELAPKGIRSNCISPSFVRTPMVEGAAETISKEVMEKFEKMMPLGFGEPNDVANAIVYLLSDASKWVTGSNMVLGG
ncbi:MAG: SDR family oxidoreductase [Bacteroidetes bacterium]|nr:SDR family oxidoreductase [Bacteroidota bacterium]